MSKLDVEDLDLSHLSIEDFLTDFDDDLSEDGLGATKRRKKARKTKRAKKSRKAKAKKASKPRRKSRKAKAKKAAKPRKRRKSRKAKAKKSRKPRRKSRRVAGLGQVANTMAQALAGNLGKAKKRRKKSRKSKSKSKAKASKPRRKTRKAKKSKAKRKSKAKGRRKSRKARKAMRGLGSLQNAVGRLSLSEVQKSKPIIGGFQWLMSKPGLESVGGGAAGALTLGLVGTGISMADKGGKLPMWLKKGLTTLTSSILMWEAGKLMKSGMAAKLGFMYPIVKLVDDELIQPYVIAPLQSKAGVSGLGQMRVPDAASFGRLAQLRLPEQTNLVGLSQIRLPEDSEAGFEDVVTDEELSGMGQSNYEMEESVF